MSKPTDLKDAAYFLCSHANNEAMRRAAISRLYYSAYHHCILFEKELQHLSQKECKGGIHRQFIFRLANPDSRLRMEERSTSIILGKALGDLYEKRINADYNLAKDISHENMRDAMELTAEIFDYYHPAA